MPAILEDNNTKETKNFLSGYNGMAWLIAVAGLIGLIASFMLSVDTYKVLKDPAFQPICNLNPLFNCGSLMKQPESEAILSIPNSLFGVVGFSFVFLTGVIMMLGTKLNRLFLKLFNIGLGLGFLSLVWFFYQSVYHLQHLCLFCMTVWTVTILLTWYVTLWNIEQHTFKLPKRCRSVSLFIRKHHFDGVVLIYFIVAILIVQHFWYFFQTL